MKLARRSAVARLARLRQRRAQQPQVVVGEDPGALAGDGQMHRTVEAVPHPDRLGLGHLAASRARGRRSPGSDTARPNVRTVVGALARASCSSSGSAPPWAASGLTTSFSPGGRSSAEVSVRGADAAGDARADAVSRGDVARAGGHRRPAAPVAELDHRRAVVLHAAREDLGIGALAVQSRRLVPAHAVDRHLEARPQRTRGRAGHEGQRRLLQREARERRRGVAAADDLAADGLAVAGGGDVGEQVGARHVEVERVVEREVDAQVLGDLGADRAGQDDDALAGDEHGDVGEARGRIGGGQREAQVGGQRVERRSRMLRARVRGPTGPTVTATWGDGALRTGGAGSGAEREPVDGRDEVVVEPEVARPSSRRPARA